MIPWEEFDIRLDHWIGLHWLKLRRPCTYEMHQGCIFPLLYWTVWFRNCNISIHQHYEYLYTCFHLMIEYVNSCAVFSFFLFRLLPHSIMQFSRYCLYLAQFIRMIIVHVMCCRERGADCEGNIISEERKLPSTIVKIYRNTRNQQLKCK